MESPSVGRWIAGSALALAVLAVSFGCGESERRPSTLVASSDDAAEEEPKRETAGGLPNIVLVIVDTLRADRLATYGHSHDTAQFLSDLAVDSVVFERAYSPSSWTAPATASILTSTYPSQHQVHTGFFVTRAIQRKRSFRLNRIPDSLPTLAEMLKQHGYRTFGVADNPNICEKMGFGRGFDRFVSYDYRGAPAVNAAVDGLADEILDDGSPYFLYVHYMDPHEPYGRREEHYDEKASGGELFANYDSEIGYTDAHIGALLGRLSAGPDTLVVVTSDHGEEFGDHGNGGHRNQLYDELLHVPLIISWPRRLSARRVAHNVSTVDIAPTVLSLLNIDAAAEGMGKTLVPSMEVERSADQPLFAMRMSEQLRPTLIRRAVIWQHWKYIWSMPSDRRELYDRRTDPDEREDLHEQSREIAGDLHQRLLSFEQGAPVYERSYTEATELTEQREDKLRAIGYAEE